LESLVVAFLDTLEQVSKAVIGLLRYTGHDHWRAIDELFDVWILLEIVINGADAHELRELFIGLFI